LLVSIRFLENRFCKYSLFFWKSDFIGIRNNTEKLPELFLMVSYQPFPVWSMMFTPSAIPASVLGTTLSVPQKANSLFTYINRLVSFKKSKTMRSFLCRLFWIRWASRSRISSWLNVRLMVTAVPMKHNVNTNNKSRILTTVLTVIVANLHKNRKPPQYT